MLRSITKLTVDSRLWLLAGVAVVSLMGTSLHSIQVLKAHVVEEREAKIRATVETVHGVLAHYERLVEAGKMSRDEAQRSAIEAIRSIRYDKREYFWINDLEPRMVMHPLAPALDGKSLANYADAQGKPLFLEFVRAIKENGNAEAFVAYRWPKPGETEPVRKRSFVKLFAPWGWIVGSGIYLGDLDAALAGEVRRILVSTALLALLLAGAGGGVAWNLKRARGLEREHRRAEATALRHQRALRTLSECNVALVRVADERSLLEAVCRAIVDVGGYRLSWVGFAEHDERKTVRPAAKAGDDEGYLSTVDVVWADTERGRGPVGTAIRTGKAVVVRDALSDPSMGPWRAGLKQRGYAALAALPLLAEGETLGALAIYATDADGFDEDELKLLEELADDLAFGIVALRGRAERARMTAQLMQADRLVAMGTLAAGVAHEINNPLAYVMAGLAFVGEELRALSPELPPGRLAELEGALEEMRDGGARIRQAVRDLKTFSRGDDETRHAIEIERLLDSSINMAFNELRHRARLVKDHGPTPRVFANESRLGQVFLNLLINAAQSIPEGAADRHEIRVTTRTDGAGRAVVEIRDTGSGIPPENLEKIFEPFFTTKPIGVGTGLGLPICRNVVTALGGEIAVESELGKGSVFRVSLPPLSGDEEAPRARRSPAATGRRGRILAIDDEPLVANAVRRTLATEHDVVVETAAGRALDRLASGDRFDVVLCDLMMPEKSGMELYAELQTAAPAVCDRIVFLTGGAFTPNARAFLDRVRNPVLEKPFESDALRALVRSLVR